MTSLFAAARLAGAGTGLAYGLQLALSLACAALIVHLFRRRGLTRESGAALLAGALLTTPFVLDYDLLLLAFPLAVLADRPRPWEKAAALAVFALLLRRAHRPETDGGRSKD
jgi:hypothetical protein